MRWLGNGSGNIEDRRGNGGRFVLGGGAAIIVVVLGLIFGQDPGQILGALQSGGGGQGSVATGRPADEGGRFVSQVLGYTDTVWTEIFRKNNLEYERPVVVLFSGQVASACGSASSATGPFYCPGDHKVYIDLSFYDELRERFGAAGDIEEALNAANAIGDDRLQEQAGGEVVPDAFTHGTSAQRMYWFKKGFDTGDLRQGDTFGEANL